MKDPLENHYRELGWRQRLTDEERAALEKFLAAHPEAKEELAAESQLNRLLEKLPEAPPVASNFTALVMQAVERETAASTLHAGRWSWLSLRVWLARGVMACAIVGAGGLAFYQHQLGERRVMAQDVATLAEAYSAAGPAPTQDFDSISRLGVETPAKPDVTLISLMQ
jgi:anti-sigma factor RsiW